LETIHPKVRAAAVAGAVVTLLLFLADVTGINVKVTPDELTSAVTALIMLVAAYSKG
jgi:hypothetical protein